MSSRKGFHPDLVERARTGDERAQEEIMTRLQPMLRVYFTKRLGRKPVVDDLVQNTLIRVHTGLPDLNDPERLKAFSMKAALFELQDLYRGRYGPKEYIIDPDHRPVQTADPGAPPGSALDVERALETLTPHARRIIELRELGYKYREIAEMVDSTEAAVKMQVKRAFDKMRDALVTVLVLVLLGVIAG